MEDHPQVTRLMQETPGVSLRDADSRSATERYLARNPGLSFVVERGETIVGSIMSGHDGRRGYLQHLLVHPDHRRQGIGQQLVTACLDGLEALGIQKSHIDVFRTNTLGQSFWSSTGWQLRQDIHRYSFIRGGRDNA